MKWMLIALVVFVLPLALLYHAIVAADPSVSHPWAIGILMTIIMIIAGFLFVSVSAYLAGLVGSVQQPGVRHHHCHHPVRLGGADAAARARLADRRGGRDHDRRGGLLRGCRRRRQPAGSQGGLHRRRHAVEAAADARHRRVLLRADHGAGAEPAGAGLRHRCADGRASERAVRTAGHADGVGRQGHVRRRIAVEHDRHRCRRRRGDHRPRRMAEGAQVDVPGAGAGRRDRHLPAAGTDGADLHRRPAGLSGGASPRHGRHQGRSRA